MLLVTGNKQPETNRHPLRRAKCSEIRKQRLNWKLPEMEVVMLLNRGLLSCWFGVLPCLLGLCWQECLYVRVNRHFSRFCWRRKYSEKWLWFGNRWTEAHPGVVLDMSKHSGRIMSLLSSVPLHSWTTIPTFLDLFICYLIIILAPYIRNRQVIANIPYSKDKLLLFSLAVSKFWLDADHIVFVLRRWNISLKWTFFLNLFCFLKKQSALMSFAKYPKSNWKL